MADDGRGDVVGLLPAAGTASRLGAIPCSKEVLPVGFTSAEGDGRPRPRAAAEPLLAAVGRAGADRAFVVVRTGKWDVPAFLETAEAPGPRRAYVVTLGTAGVPFTLASAVPFLEGARVLFGFPDILFEPEDAFARLLDRQEERGADLVLGLFPAGRPEKMDMVRLGPDGGVRSLVIKPEATDLRYTWILAAWTPAFTDFLAGWCRDRRARYGRPGEGGSGEATAEPHLGHVVRDALDGPVEVEAVIFDEGRYVDIGTPAELASAMAGRVRPDDGPGRGGRPHEANSGTRGVEP